MVFGHLVMGKVRRAMASGHLVKETAHRLMASLDRLREKVLPEVKGIVLDRREMVSARHAREMVRLAGNVIVHDHPEKVTGHQATGLPAKAIGRAEKGIDRRVKVIARAKVVTGLLAKLTGHVEHAKKVPIGLADRKPMLLRRAMPPRKSSFLSEFTLDQSPGDSLPDFFYF